VLLEHAARLDQMPTHAGVEMPAHRGMVPVVALPRHGGSYKTGFLQSGSWLAPAEAGRAPVELLRQALTENSGSNPVGAKTKPPLT